MKELTTAEKEALSIENRSVVDIIYDSENDILLNQYENVDGYFYTESSGNIFWVNDNNAYGPDYLEKSEFVGQNWGEVLK